MNFINLLFSVLGLIIGSYISALTYRIPLNISNNKGRSFCDKCKKQIRWFDNVPLFSYIILGGKCRECKKKISVRYPLIELFTGIIFYLISLGNYASIITPIYLLVIFSILIAIFVIDLENKYIPDELTFWGMGISFFYTLLMANSHILFSNILAGFICAFSLLMLHIFTKGRGMGLGDVKFAIFGGMFIGSSLATVWLLLAFLTGGIAGSILILTKKAKMKDQIAFGPFLVFALMLTFVFGNKISMLIGL